MNGLGGGGQSAPGNVAGVSGGTRKLNYSCKIKYLMSILVRFRICLGSVGFVLKPDTGKVKKTLSG